MLRSQLMASGYFGQLQGMNVPRDCESGPSRTLHLNVRKGRDTSLQNADFVRYRCVKRRMFYQVSEEKYY